ncbi:pyridoxal phosphate-dependent transferase [Sporodiniella umbellata]|nr:pyridoxal phosphate-dependent transferase [Sporodiniella umbellata]
MAHLPEPPSQVGAAIPAHTPHAVSVMFPTWQDNIYYEEGNPIVTSKMECGYPRFFIHPLIQQLERYLVPKFGKPNDRCLLFPSHRAAQGCRAFMERTETEVRLAEFELADPEGDQRLKLHLVLFPQVSFPIAKQFWQHSGDIISSRMAEYCLAHLDTPTPIQGPKARPHYQKRSSLTRPEREQEQAVYLEERYGRNLPVALAERARVALRRRIAGILEEGVDTGERHVNGLSEKDVYLYPCGMGAIYHAFLNAMTVGDDSLKSVCFGFPYTDTLKILQKWGAGCHFYGLGENESVDGLEALLASGHRILSLFCELPSNPLLKTPDLRRLRALADQYGFMMVIDETIGNFCNVDALSWADVVVSSLTKIFSGDSNVMGGSLVLNPKSVYYTKLKDTLDRDYEDLVWSEDVVFLERNSRTFRARNKIINENTEALCDFLHRHEKVQTLFYPKYTTPENYNAVKLKTPDAGYGGLFSMLLKDEKSAAQFYDHLQCAKGPSLGTNFTLVSPYTILAHYTELDWAAQFGVHRHLVRVSVGLEGREKLLSLFGAALDAVE